MLIALAGIVGGVTIWFVAGARADDAVRSLARAPVGCDTTLDFADAGDYLVFVETKGDLPAVRGDCSAEGAFDLAADSAPTVDVSIVDPDGEEVAVLSRRGRESYDRAGATGESLARISIRTAGDHVVRVETSSTSSFAVAIGTDPTDGLGVLRLLALAVAALGVVAGIVVAVARRSAPPQPVAVAPAPPSAWQIPPPTGPPPMHPTTGPPAGQAWVGQPSPPPPSVPPPSPEPVTGWSPTPPPQPPAPSPPPPQGAPPPTPHTWTTPGEPAPSLPERDPNDGEHPDRITPPS